MRRIIKCALILCLCLMLTAWFASCKKAPGLSERESVSDTQPPGSKPEANEPAELKASDAASSPAGSPDHMQEYPQEAPNITSQKAQDTSPEPSKGASSVAQPAGSPPSAELPAESPNGTSEALQATSPSATSASGTESPAAEPSAAEPATADTNTAEPSAAGGASPQPTSAAAQTVSPTSSPAETQSGSQTGTQTPSPATPSAGNHSTDDPVVLTITGSGVSSESLWTLNDLKSMREGYREYTYSTTNNWPRYGHMTARGVSLPYLLMQADIKSNAAAFKLIANDGFYAVVTLNQVYGVMYSYSSHSSTGSSGAYTVEPVIAWEWGEGSGTAGVREEDLRTFFGHKGPNEVNTSVFVTDVCVIEVLTEAPGVWEAPGASVANGTVVPSGALLELTHDKADNVKIYYTLDGSEPDYTSFVYNPSTSFFQPQLTIPVTLTESVTVKAFAGGYGKDASAVVTFRYIVES